MRFFSKKKEVEIDYDALFKEQYHSLNKLRAQAYEEPDYVIKDSLFVLIIEKYDELLELIDKGARYDRARFESYRHDAEKELQVIRDIYKG